MFRALVSRSFRDSWPMLASCWLLGCGFVILKIVASSRIKVDSLLLLLSENLKFVQNLLPVSIEDMASPLGRSAFSFEELPVAALTALWTIARGSECIAGRVGAGTMEMLLAQPVRRSTVVASHTLVTLAGAVALALAAWLGIAVGLAIAQFDNSPSAALVWPAVAILCSSQVFLLGASTFLGAVLRTRAQAVGVMAGFYLVELAVMIVSRLAPDYTWLPRLTFVTAYEPTLLTLGLARDPQTYWPIFWRDNLCLLGLGGGLLVLATAIFCHRDVPAPL